MTRKLRYLFILLFISVTGGAFAQSGAIVGTVVDDKKVAVQGAVIEVSQGGIVKNGNVTDEDGNYTIKPLDPGRYDVTVKMNSYKTNVVTGVIVSPDKNTGVNATLVLDVNKLNDVVITTYKVPLVDAYSTGSSKTLTSDDIEKMPTRNTNDIAATSAGVYSKSAGAGLSISGGRTDATKYIIDGITVYNQNSINMAQNSIDQIEVMTSGLSAKYGDAIGGIISITTKGVSEKTRGSLLLERSIDGYNHNLANFSLSGPIYSKKNADGTKEPIIGFFAGVEATYDGDRKPSYGGNYVLKEDVRKQLEATPLLPVSSQNGTNGIFRPASEFLTANDFEIVKARQNAGILEGKVSAKFDIKLAENLSLTAGGNFIYDKSSRYGLDPSGFRGYSYISGSDIPNEIDYTGRGYIRLTQRFSKAQTTAEEKRPLISNAYYQLQADYQREFRNFEDPDHKRNLFDYGYVGKFNTQYTSQYDPGTDTATHRLGIKLTTDHQAVQTSYQRSEINPVLANYTSEIYNFTGGSLPGDIQILRAIGGLANGDLPNYTYRTSAPNSPTWSSIGTRQGYYQFFNSNQFSVSIDASFDLQPGKTKHAIEFGLYYQQQNQSRFAAQAADLQGGSTLWQYMRQLTNSHISLSADPTFIINGQRYTKDDVNNGLASPSPLDTILYDRVANTQAQSTFDKNLRAKIGAGATDYLNVDAMDPSTFSLNMFSADELLNSGSPFVTYQGYDYTGKKQKGQINFNDFFTKKDANGNYTRDVGAYRPNYIAGYILDKFSFKDINFNIGVRIDRFDANTKMLKDPYSLYEVQNVSSAKAQTLNIYGDGTRPTNIKDDYVVYVNSNESSSPTVIGYRNGDDWYDYKGRLVEDPSVLRNYSGGRDPQPLLVDSKIKIADSNFNPNSSFTDYKPQVNVMPRVQFSFPISDAALFYAHYDVVVQRPSNTTSEIYATPVDYYFLTQKSSSYLINNPGLKPEKLFDYEIGFQQKLTNSSAITISTFYKERKDMIQVRPYLFAWPRTYYTFGNRDFSTTKGMTLAYDLRRTGNIKINIAYTLQFAEGTGNSANSGNGGSSTVVNGSSLLSNFVSAGLPNLRYTTALDVDSRHIISTTVDYRIADNEGPVVGGMHILQNAGVNFIFRARSGEPYTAIADPNSSRILGELNGARYPWHYGVDMRIDKDFSLSFGKKPAEGAAQKRKLSVNAYILIQNLLNTRDVIAVNGYTGRADDDGYITSPQGIQDVQKQTNALSYTDIYYINSINPYNLNLPRRASVGLQFNF